MLCVVCVQLRCLCIVTSLFRAEVNGSRIVAVREVEPNRVSLRLIDVQQSVYQPGSYRRMVHWRLGL
jgi:hypothetical protein